jgi:sugar/nucleoside kinase (ribokinase family)
VAAIATIGPLSRDVVAGASPRPGGPVFYATRTLAHLGADACAAASCASRDKAELVAPLKAFGLPVAWYESSTTTAYRFYYERDRRVMEQEAVGDPWTASCAVDAAGDAGWVHVGGLVRTDFPAETLAALAEPDRTLLVDGQGLVRTPSLGPLRTDRDIGNVLDYVSILHLDEEEAETLVGSPDPERLSSLGVSEVILTLGSHGSVVVTPKLIERIPAVEVQQPVDPTGAGDTFSATYLARRAGGAEPAEAARSAAETVASLLAAI